MTIDFICEELAELFDSPCNYSPIDEKMFQDSYCESHCGKVTDKECWKQYFEKVWADRKTEPQTYVINPQEPTNDDKCFECDDFFTCDGQCDEVETEPQTDCETCRHYNPHHEAIACERCLDGKYNHYEPKDEPQRGCDADCNEDCAECAKEWQDWKDQMWQEAVIASKTEPQFDKDINVRSKDEPYIDIETGILHWCGWKYRRIYEDEPQTEMPRCSVNGTPFDECGFCEYFNCDTCKCEADVTQTERSE